MPVLTGRTRGHRYRRPRRGLGRGADRRGARLAGVHPVRHGRRDRHGVHAARRGGGARAARLPGGAGHAPVHVPACRPAAAGARPDVHQVRADRQHPAGRDQAGAVRGARRAARRRRPDVARAGGPGWPPRTGRSRRPRSPRSTVRRSPAAASPASTRARLRDGREIALKVKRPGIDGRMAADLALLRAVVKACERMPKLRGMPLSDLIGYLSIAVLGQLDFDREAANIVRLRETLAPVPGVRVPELIPELCRPGCLAFEYIAGLDRRTPESLPDATRARLAATVLAAAHTMMFVDGFVHCDLHPGNVYLTPEEDVVILDAGYSVQLSGKVRRLIGEFFERMAAGDGRRCGEIVLESAANVSPRTDTQAFVDAVAAHVEANAGPGVAFDMPKFGEGMFDLQRDHGLYAASDFAFPLMSLLVLEGTVQGFAPAVDFQQVGAGSTQ
ncbi:MAG: phosphotransferase [Streptosporangiales bacterium]|nr:phosphotransferase [Streptosporangiales bacterium]